MDRSDPSQLNLPLVASNVTKPSLEDLRELRRKLPAHIHFGAHGWTYPEWGPWVWSTAASLHELQLHGLRRYAEWPLFDTILLPVGVETEERDLRALRSQLVDTLTYFIDAPALLTTFRVTHHNAQVLHRPAGQANPNFLNVRYWQDFLALCEQTLSDHCRRVIVRIPSDIELYGLQPSALFARIETLLAATPSTWRVLVELQSPNHLNLDYARLLAAHNARHVFTLAPSMPTLAQQKRAVPGARWYCVHVQGMEPSNDTVHSYREDIETHLQLVDFVTNHPDQEFFILVDNHAEGDAAQTIVHLAKKIVSKISV